MRMDWGNTGEINPCIKVPLRFQHRSPYPEIRHRGYEFNPHFEPASGILRADPAHAATNLTMSPLVRYFQDRSNGPLRKCHNQCTVEIDHGSFRFLGEFHRLNFQRHTRYDPAASPFLPHCRLLEAQKFTVAFQPYICFDCLQGSWTGWRKTC